MELERLEWQNGEIVHYYNNSIKKVIPIGKPKVFGSVEAAWIEPVSIIKSELPTEGPTIQAYLKKKAKEDKSYEEVNAYLLGEISTVLDNEFFAIPVSFFKVEFND